MDFKHLKIELQDKVATVIVNRPKALNALNSEVIEELKITFSEVLIPSELIGVIITGSGDKAFVAGADISEFNTLDEQTGSKLSRAGKAAFDLIERFPIPVIAAINGYSLGGGNELAMACHIRICSENAKFGQPEVNLGLIPGFGGTQRLIQYIGKGRAMELLLSGDMIDAAKALDYGLVTHVANAEDLLTLANKLISKISSKGPLAVSRIIETVNAYFDKSVDGFEMESLYFGKTIDSEECTEGVNAFLEKRKPSFRK